MPKKKEKKILPNQVNQNIVDASYCDVMEKSYIDYSMSVITARAVPDVRDGLKPVQRRIIYDMNILGVTSDRPYRKSARIVGDTMGKFHAHGDSSIYGALVTMAQDFKYNIPLADGHGNFGSIEGDGCAAARYTEARLSTFSEDVLLDELKNGTVDFIPNYDETEKEPSVLPCLLPNILINGSEGIAVGMTTNIPPHNTAEVIDSAIYYIKHKNGKKLNADELLNILHGPDFPTGGIIANKAELADVYRTGQGKIRIRGKVELEKGENGHYSLVITEIPYTMIGSGISKFLSDTAALVEDRTLSEISDILDQTSKDGIRIVLELKKGAEKDAERIKNILYKKTKLEDTFGVNMFVIDDGIPKTMSLTDVLQSYYSFQETIQKRKAIFLLEKYKKKKEIDEGLIRAVDLIDVIIEVLRGSKDVKTAKNCLMSGNTDTITFRTEKSRKQAAKLNFTEPQAQAILDMKLSRLIKLELTALEKDLAELNAGIKKNENILENETARKNEIIKTLEKLKEKYKEKRKTEIKEIEEVKIEEKKKEAVPVTVLVDRFLYAHAIDTNTYEKNKETVNAEYKYVIKTVSDCKLYLFTDTGKMHSAKVSDIPAGRLRDKGVPFENISNYKGKNENIINIVPSDEKKNLLFISSDGKAKRVLLSEFDVSRKTVDATKLNPDAHLVSVLTCDETGTSLIFTAGGTYLRFRHNTVPEMKKASVGVCCIKMADDMVCEAYTFANSDKIIKREEKEIEIKNFQVKKIGTAGIRKK